MTNAERDIQRKLRVLPYAEQIGNSRKACRYFGIDGSSFVDGAMHIESMVKPGRGASGGWMPMRFSTCL